MACGIFFFLIFFFFNYAGYSLLCGFFSSSNEHGLLIAVVFLLWSMGFRADGLQ